MAGKIRGITIQLDGDTSGLTNSLKTANKEIKNTQDQLKDVDKLLKLDPTNTELLRQKQELLGKAIGESGSKLDDLKKAEEAMKAKGVDENSEAFMALQREIAETETNMKSLKKEAENTSKGIGQVATVAEKVGTAAGKIAKKTEKLSLAAGGLVAGLAGMGMSSISSADELQTLSKRTGVSTDTLQKFSYASEMVDVSTEEMATAFKKMKIQMDKNPEAFEALGVSVRDADGSFRDLETVFFESLGALSGIGDETERDLASMEIFGKNADSLATIIDDGGAALQEYGLKAQEMGLILSEDTIARMVETGDQIDSTKAQMSMTITELGAQLMTELAPTIDNILTKIQEVITWIGSLDGDTLNTIVTVGLVIAAISPIASLVSGISTAIGGVSTALEFLMANPIVALIAAIVGLVVLIATKGDEIQEKLNELDQWFQNVFSTDWSEQFGFLGEIMNLFFSVFGGVWDGIKEILDGVIDFIRGVFSGDWDRAWEGIKKIFSGVFDGILSIFTRVSDFITGIFSKDWTEKFGVFGNIINAFGATVTEVFGGVKEIFQGIVDFVKNIFSGNWEGAWESVKNIFKGIWDTLVSIVKAPLNLIIGIINGLIDGLNWIIRGINKISFTIPDWVPFIGGKTVGFNIGEIGHIAYLAQGGVLQSGSAVVGEAGPELLTMSSQGAVVQPLTRNNTQNFGGVNINVYGSAGQSVEELAQIIMDEIGNATRRQEAVFG